MDSHLSARDPQLVLNIVNHLKSQGIFDQFRRECLADVDTKPSFQNLRQRVEVYVSKFLSQQTWKPDLNKNQLRDALRKQINDSGMLSIGVEHVVDQVVNPKISRTFLPQIESVVRQYLGLERPAELAPNNEKKEEPREYVINTGSSIQDVGSKILVKIESQPTEKTPDCTMLVELPKKEPEKEGFPQVVTGETIMTSIPTMEKLSEVSASTETSTSTVAKVHNDFLVLQTGNSAQDFNNQILDVHQSTDDKTSTSLISQNSSSLVGAGKTILDSETQSDTQIQVDNCKDVLKHDEVSSEMLYDENSVSCADSNDGDSKLVINEDSVMSESNMETESTNMVGSQNKNHSSAESSSENSKELENIKSESYDVKFDLKSIKEEAPDSENSSESKSKESKVKNIKKEADEPKDDKSAKEAHKKTEKEKSPSKHKVTKSSESSKTKQGNSKSDTKHKSSSSSSKSKDTDKMHKHSSSSTSKSKSEPKSTSHEHKSKSSLIKPEQKHKSSHSSSSSKSSEKSSRPSESLPSSSKSSSSSKSDKHDGEKKTKSSSSVEHRHKSSSSDSKSDKIKSSNKDGSSKSLKSSDDKTKSHSKHSESRSSSDKHKSSESSKSSDKSKVKESSKHSNGSKSSENAKHRESSNKGDNKHAKKQDSSSKEMIKSSKSDEKRLSHSHIKKSDSSSRQSSRSGCEKSSSSENSNTCDSMKGLNTNKQQLDELVNTKSTDGQREGDSLCKVEDNSEICTSNQSVETAQIKCETAGTDSSSKETIKKEEEEEEKPAKTQNRSSQSKEDGVGTHKLNKPCSESKMEEKIIMKEDSSDSVCILDSNNGSSSHFNIKDKSASAQEKIEDGEKVKDHTTQNGAQPDCIEKSKHKSRDPETNLSTPPSDELEAHRKETCTFTESKLNELENLKVQHPKEEAPGSGSDNSNENVKEEIISEKSSEEIPDALPRPEEEKVDLMKSLVLRKTDNKTASVLDEPSDTVKDSKNADDVEEDNKSDISVSSVHTSDLSSYDDKISLSSSDELEAVESVNPTVKKEKKVALKEIKEVAATYLKSRTNSSGRSTPVLPSGDDDTSHSTSRHRLEKPKTETEPSRLEEESQHSDDDDGLRGSSRFGRQRKANPKYASEEYISNTNWKETDLSPAPVAPPRRTTRRSAEENVKTPLKSSSLPSPAESTPNTPPVNKVPGRKRRWSKTSDKTEQEKTPESEGKPTVESKSKERLASTSEVSSLSEGQSNIDEVLTRPKRKSGSRNSISPDGGKHRAENQRYDSSDLYKPRPVIGARRRTNKEASNTEQKQEQSSQDATSQAKRPRGRPRKRPQTPEPQAAPFAKRKR